MSDLTQMLVGGIPMLVVIFGLVEFSKKFGLSGHILTAFSMGLGLVFGILFKVATLGLPVGFPDWFEVVVFGLALGLVTCGLYDFAAKRFPEIPG